MKSAAPACAAPPPKAAGATSSGRKIASTPSSPSTPTKALIGLGSVFTNDALVRAALAVLEPLYRGENALEPERVSEKLHQNTFWLGRGGSITHAISGIDIALWDILGQATGQPVGRLLGGRYRERVQPYASLLMDEPAKLREHLLAVKAQGFRAFKIGWGPFGRRSAAHG